MRDIEHVYKEIGERIYRLRISRGMTQGDLRDALKMTANLARSSLTNIENGRQRIYLHDLYHIADTFGVAISELIPGELAAPGGIRLVKKD